jgi:DNA replication protein DnaD
MKMDLAITYDLLINLMLLTSQKPENVVLIRRGSVHIRECGTSQLISVHLCMCLTTAKQGQLQPSTKSNSTRTNNIIYK